MNKTFFRQTENLITKIAANGLIERKFMFLQILSQGAKLYSQES